MDRRVVQVALDQHVHTVVEGGGEEHALAVCRRPVENPADHRQEAHVGHLVGLIQHGDADLVERNHALPHQVEQPPRAGDQNVDTTGKGLHLGNLGDPTEDGPAGQPGRCGQRFERLLDLGGEFTGRRKDQRPGTLGAAALRHGRQTRNHGQQEGVRLA